MKILKYVQHLLSLLLFYPWLLLLTLGFDSIFGDQLLVTTLKEGSLRLLLFQSLNDLSSTLFPAIIVYMLILVTTRLFSVRHGVLVIIFGIMGAFYGAVLAPGHSLILAIYYLLLLGGFAFIPLVINNVFEKLKYFSSRRSY